MRRRASRGHLILTLRMRIPRESLGVRGCSVRDLQVVAGGDGRALTLFCDDVSGEGCSVDV